jgi:hypothetical protein
MKCERCDKSFSMPGGDPAPVVELYSGRVVAPLVQKVICPACRADFERFMACAREDPLPPLLPVGAAPLPPGPRPYNVAHGECDDCGSVQQYRLRAYHFPPRPAAVAMLCDACIQQRTAATTIDIPKRPSGDPRVGPTPERELGPEPDAELCADCRKPVHQSFLWVEKCAPALHLCVDCFRRRSFDISKGPVGP